MLADKEFIDDDQVYWHGHGRPPIDRIIRERRIEKPNIYIQVNPLTLFYC